jgi:hypothetical protein
MVDDRDKKSPTHQNPVEERYVKLTMKDLGGMHNFDLWEVREFHDLAE